MTMLSLTTEGGRTEFIPGEKIALRAQWALDKAAVAIEVRLVWHAQGKNATHIEIYDRDRLESPPLSGEHNCEFDLPTAPFSFSGKLIELEWGAELVLLPSLEAMRLDLTVGPHGKKVVLYDADIEQANGDN